jgi:hypothetical protein
MHPRAKVALDWLNMIRRKKFTAGCENLKWSLSSMSSVFFKKKLYFEVLEKFGIKNLDVDNHKIYRCAKN